MRLKLVNTTAFRLSLIYALLFSLISTGAISFLYWNSAKEIRNQTDYQLRVETDALLEQYASGHISALSREMNRLDDYGHSSFFLYVLRTRDQFDFIEQIQPGVHLKVGKSIYGTVPLKSIVSVHRSSRVDKKQLNQPARVLLTLLPDGYQMLVGTDLIPRQQLLKRMLNVIITLIIIVFTLALAGGALIGYGVLHRINSIRQTAGEIIEGDLSQRMQVTTKNDEFDRLSTVLNAMLSRIEQLMQSMHQVTDNLAHDLRNPLNRLRNRLDVSLIENLDKAGYQRVQEEAISDIDDIIRTFNALLNITQAESGKHDHDWTQIDLKPFIEELAELYSIVAEESGITFENDIKESRFILGDHQLLAQTFTNLLDNAMKFTPKGGLITMTTRFANQKAIIEITDNGPGIPEDKREEVFERFVRLDSARSTPGNGLGLSLVKAVVERHNGAIELEDNHPGLRVILSFSTEIPKDKKAAN
ncbi:MAG: two-component sensor histidine kinase [Proteobacteria bacterium]|nr:MAG: two-component sensor histidine kinase [Pseudomonadota bacterium]